MNAIEEGWDWTCPYCGHENHNESILNERKICEHCGEESTDYMPEDDEENWGYD